MEGIEYLFSTPGWDRSSSHLWWSELLGTLRYIHRSSRASYTVVVAKMGKNHLFFWDCKYRISINIAKIA